MFRLLLLLLGVAMLPLHGLHGEGIIEALGVGNLQGFKEGALHPYDEVGLRDKRLFVLYFSAQWCPPCRLFTPRLLAAYERLKAKHPDFEVILISRDTSAFTMERHVRSYSLPWPVVKYGATTGLERYKVNDALPNLVVVNAAGEVLASSHVKLRYVGPEAALEQLERALTSTPPLSPVHPVSRADGQD